MKTRLTARLAGLLLAALAPFAAVSLRAQTSTPVLTDDFTDGDRVDWYGVNAPTLTVNSTAASAITGNGLFVDQAGTFRAVVATFSPVTLVATGNYIKLSFDVRIFGPATTATSGTLDFPSADGELRIGFYNSNATALTVNNSTESNDDFGYRVGVPFGSSGSVAGGTFGQETGTDSSRILSGSDSSSVTNVATAGGVRIQDNAVYNLTLTATKTANGVSLLQEVYSGTTLIYSSAGLDETSVVYTSFNEFALGSTSDIAYRVDNVSVVSFSSIPEPSTVALSAGLGVMGLAVLGRRPRFSPRRNGSL